MAVSKNARKVTVKAGSDEDLVAHAATSPLSVFIPLHKGWVYYRNPLGGASEHIDRGSEEFLDRIAPAAEMGLLPRIKEELENFDQLYPTEKYGETLEKISARFG